MEGEDHYKALLQKYIRGQSSPEETERVLRWLRTAQGISVLKEKIDKESVSAFQAVPELDPRISGEIYARLEDRLKEDRNRPRSALVRLPAFFSKFPGFSKNWQVAAALTGFLLLAGAGYLAVNNYNTITYTTDYAQKEVVILPDHSTVTLNGDSRLSFSRNWEDKATREVHLDGEAFFEVVRQEDKPFIVTTSEIGIKVLGTSFNVKSYDEEETIETTLVSGKVVIRDLGKDPVKEQIVLKPNQKATYSKKSANIVLDDVKTELYTSWKSGMLIFEDEPFGEIARELERWYGVQINIEEENSRNCRFTIKIRDEPLAEILRLFSSTTGAGYSIRGKNVTIKGNLCN